MSKSNTDREVLSAKISLEAVNGWKKFCQANGVTLTAMIEVAGIELGKETHPPTIPTRINMVGMAREIDISRRSRKR